MSDRQNVSFLDLAGLHQELETELLPVIQKVLRSAGFIGGPMVQDFEAEFARFCDASHCVGLASGTDAVRFALIAAGIQPGDVVLTVPMTFIATTEGISQAGAQPDFVDVDPLSYAMDPEKVLQYLEANCSLDRETGKMIHRKLGKPVTALVPVHLYGQMADMDALMEIARRYRMLVIEDACQAHGAEYFSKKENRWRKAGSIGQAAAFSFYPGKNLGACGEAGALTTNDEAIAQKVRMLRDHGQARKYYHDIEGYNGRLDAMQAGILSVKLKHLPEWNRKRRDAAARYGELLGDVSDFIRLPHQPAWSRPVYHIYAVCTPERASLQDQLSAAGIGTGIHYPVPLHLQKAYSQLGYGVGDFPVSEKIGAQELSLPMDPRLTDDGLKAVADEIHQYVGARASVKSH